MTQPQQEPRIVGSPNIPSRTTASRARDAFIEVLVDAAAVRNPSTLAVSYVEPAVKLKDSVDTARVWCNEELGRRLTRLYEVAIEESMGGTPSTEWGAVHKSFTEGCRIALGTND